MPKLIAGIFAIATFASATLATVLTGPTPAQAGIEYPWCAQYAEGTVGATNCGFVNLQQCRAAVSGVGGTCYENPAYAVAGPQPKRHRDRR